MPKNVKTHAIASDEHYGWMTGLTEDGRQVLCTDVGCLFFDSVGSFLKIQDLGDSLDWRKHADELVATPSTIHVRAFDLPERQIGIKGMPLSYEEFLRDPQSFNEEDGSLYPDWIASWKEDNLFVFMLGDDFWMNADGSVNSH